MANSVDPDETPRSAASHLGLHCLLNLFVRMLTVFTVTLKADLFLTIYKTGVKQVICDGLCLDTDDNIDYGFRWKDLGSENSDHCTSCYMKGIGELDHGYVRYTTKKSLV